VEELQTRSLRKEDRRWLNRLPLILGEWAWETLSSKAAPSEPVYTRLSLDRRGRLLAVASFRLQLDGGLRLLGIAARLPETSLAASFRQLLTSLEPALGIRRTFYVFEEASDTDDLRTRRTLDLLGFQSPDALGDTVYARTAHQRMDFWQARLRPPSGIQLIPWRDLAPPALKRLVHEDLQRWQVPYSVDPRRELGVVDPICSVAAVDRDGRVVGWMLCHQRPGVLRYSALYVARAQRLGQGRQGFRLGFSLVAHAATQHILQNALLYPRWSYSTLTANRESKRMMNKIFVDKNSQFSQIMGSYLALDK